MVLSFLSQLVIEGGAVVPHPYSTLRHCYLGENCFHVFTTNSKTPRRCSLQPNFSEPKLICVGMSNIAPWFWFSLYTQVLDILCDFTMYWQMFYNFERNFELFHIV